LRFHARAPGKVILLGEHFVVHGNPALSAALDRGVEAVAEESNEDIVISRALGAECPIARPTPSLTPLCLSLRQLLGDRSWNGVKVILETAIPVSAGLGSSAASAVAALVAVAARFGGHLNGDELYEYAMVSERAVHGNPSGVDVYVAINGGLVYFKGKKRRQVVPYKRFPIMVSCTGIERNTGELIARVAEFRRKAPDLFRTWATSSERLVEDCVKALEEGRMNVVAESMNFHQQALKAMGVSTPELDALVREARGAGFAGAKLTGAGGGGCIIGLHTGADYQAALDAFRAKRPNSFLSYVPSEGVSSWSTQS
jgi:mevalonate kinase